MAAEIQLVHVADGENRWFDENRLTMFSQSSNSLLRAVQNGGGGRPKMVALG
jgi:hypothetical protein